MTNYIKTKCEICETEYEYDEDNPRIRDKIKGKTYDSSRFCCIKCHYKAVAKKSFATFRAKNPGVSSPCHLPGVQEKVIETCMKKYGVKHGVCSKQAREKAQRTCLAKTGFKTPLENKDIRQKAYESNLKNHDGIYHLNTEECRKLSAEGHRTSESRQKARARFNVEEKRQEMLNKFGVKNAFELEKIQDKIKRTNIEKYGVDNPGKSPEILTKRIETRMLTSAQNLENFNKDFIFSKFVTNEQKFDLESCSNYFNLTLHASNYFKEKFEIEIPNLTPKDNTLESEFCQHIQSLTDKQITRHERKLFNNKMELNVYIPEMNLAFEFNGDYWHSENVGVPSDYHLWKTNMCKEKGIRLIHIWEHEWVNDSEKIKIFLNSLLTKRSKIRASKCIIKKIPSKEFLEFGEKYHLLGSSNSGTRIGLYYNDELVSALGLSYSDSKKEWELKRYIVGNYQVMGGFSKMFKYFIEEFNPEKVTTFVELSKFTGQVNYNNGFELCKVMPPDFFWVIKGERVDKWTAWKHYRQDGQLTHDYQEMMKKISFKCYDSGKEKLVWINHTK